MLSSIVVYRESVAKVGRQVLLAHIAALVKAHQWWLLLAGPHNSTYMKAPNINEWDYL